MTQYAIKIVPPEWEDAMPLPFDQATYYGSEMEQGTRVLLYRQGEGIIGEGEIHGYAVHPREWPQTSKDDLPPSLASADFLQPIGILYRRKDAIPLETVRDALGDPAFPQRENWRPLDDDQYRRLTDWP